MREAFLPAIAAPRRASVSWPGSITVIVLLAALHAAALIAVRPMFQISDEVAYFSGAQAGALSRAGVDRFHVAPPDGDIVDTYLTGKPLFRWLAGGLYLRLMDAFPPATAALALRSVLSVSAVVTVVFAALIARQLAPGVPLVSVGTPLLIALHPIFMSYAAAITPDSLANAASTMAVWLMLRFAAGVSHVVEPLVLCGLVVLAFLLKDTTFFLLPGVCLAVAARGIYARERLGSWSRAVRSDRWLAAAALVMLASPSVLLVERARQVLLDSTNIVAFTVKAADDTLGMGAGVFFDHVQPVSQFATFWGALGNFGGNDVFLPDALLGLLGLVCVIGVVGLMGQLIAPRVAAAPGARRQILLLLVLTAVIALQAPLRDFLLGEEGAVQGRWLFPMMAPLMAMLCLGWSWFVRANVRALPLVGLVFASVAVYALVAVLIPAFYDSFPDAYRTENLFLVGPFGRELEMSRVEVFLERPLWLRSMRTAGTPVALFTLAALAWPVWMYVFLRRAEGKSRASVRRSVS